MKRVKSSGSVKCPAASFCSRSFISAVAAGRMSCSRLPAKKAGCISSLAGTACLGGRETRIGTSCARGLVIGGKGA